MTFHEQFDLIQQEHNINKTKDFLLNYLETSIKEHREEDIIICLNETIGFFRDIEDFTNSSKYAKSLANLLNKIDINPDAIFVSFINIANAFRANKEYDLAKSYFMKALNIYNENNLDNKSDLAALYNNLGLMYQNIDLDNAINYFNQAINLIKDINQVLRLGITYINLSYSYLGKNDINNLKKYLDFAFDIFNNFKDDFHYSSLLALNAKYLYLIKEYDKSYKFYKLALSHFDKFQGRSETYFNLYGEFKKVCEILNYPSFKKLLDLNKEYFELSFKTFPKDLLDCVVIGSFGYGSENNYLDDLISIDHDYEPGFIILTKDDISDLDFKKLRDYYNNLDEFYDIYYIRKNKRYGVFKYSEYLRNIGIENELVNDESLNLLTNGKIFYSGFDSFINLRKMSLLKYKLSLKDKIAKDILLINQLMYNIDRENRRGNNLVCKYLKTNIIDNLINLYYHINSIPKIHDKERLKLIKKTSLIYQFISKMLNNKYDLIKDKMNNYLITVLFKNNLISNKDTNYIEDYRNEILYNVETYNKKLEIAMKITEIEFSMHKALNAYGGVQECQTNISYYYNMRISQHINMSLEFLNSYLSDLEYARDNNISLPFIKYAFMEEFTDNKLYQEAKKYLPTISEKRRKLQEAIISLQIEMLQKYQKTNSDYLKMRTIYSSTDSINNASYETYLRAELSSYSENSVLEYAKELTRLSKRKENFVKKVVNTSKFLYV